MGTSESLCLCKLILFLGLLLLTFSLKSKEQVVDKSNHCLSGKEWVSSKRVSFFLLPDPNGHYNGIVSTETPTWDTHWCVQVAESLEGACHCSLALC